MVTALAILFFVLGLNLSGVFEFATWCRRRRGLDGEKPVRKCSRLRRGSRW